MSAAAAVSPTGGDLPRKRHGDTSPMLPAASPLAVSNPLGPGTSPCLTTPCWAGAKHHSDSGFAALGFGELAGSSSPTYDTRGGKLAPPGSTGGYKSGASNLLGGLSDIDKWGWEVGSDVGSVPSAWSKPSTMHSSVHSRISSATGDGLIPGLVDGQRLSTVKPSSVPTAGGKIVVSLRKEVPQGYWDSLEIVLVNGPQQVKLKPTGIKKGKKLCVEVPPGLASGDYDVRLSFNQKIIHGAIPLSIHDGDALSDDGSNDDEEIAEGLRRLQASAPP
eukprot:TRINITY_DN92856_c0_g1_i1.p1 TRINITY_DN92856_c0_g1~~TRINITY_DN92856_c0_g1_i1.p1  ORF type:complete len:276 (-),score=19.08 TRINITY_DN92856_c0_g1_i1:163-990(-)